MRVFTPKTKPATFPESCSWKNTSASHKDSAAQSKPVTKARDTRNIGPMTSRASRKVLMFFIQFLSGISGGGFFFFFAVIGGKKKIKCGLFQLSRAWRRLIADNARPEHQ